MSLKGISRGSLRPIQDCDRNKPEPLTYLVASRRLLVAYNSEAREADQQQFSVVSR